MISNDKVKNTHSEMMPEPALRRLPWYLAYLTTLKIQNVEFISTTRIAEELRLAPSQIAKDLSFLGLRGKTRIGYSVIELENTLRDFLGFSQRHNAVMVGTGSLGAALIADSGLQRYGLNIVAGIDVKPELIGSAISGVPVYNMCNLQEIVKQLGIRIAILAVPVDCAQTAADSIVAAGIQCIWNFTPTRLALPDNIVVTNTSIYSHLAVMYNRLSSLDLSE